MREMYCERGVAFIVAPATGDGFNNNQMFCFVFFFFSWYKGSVLLLRNVYVY